MNNMKYARLGDVSVMERGTSLTQKMASPGSIPVISGGREPAFYCNKWNREGETITVAGSGAGAGYVQYWDTPIFVNDAFSIKGTDKVLTKFIYYCLVNMQDRIYATKKGGGVPHVHISNIEHFQIPIPPLPVQHEIVRILDTFSQLANELANELAARKKQYAHYRETLLNFQESCDVKYARLGDVSVMERGTSLTQKIASPGSIPVISGGREPAFYCNKWNREGETITVAGSGAGAGYVQYWDTPIFVNDAFSIKGTDKVLTKFIYYCLVNMQDRIYATKKGGGVPHVHISNIEHFQIPLPPLSAQKRIVHFLDDFEAVCNDLQIGLPAEIEARRKQYEYYRDMLLSFNPANTHTHTHTHTR